MNRTPALVTEKGSQKPNACEICPKSFFSKQDLVRHRRVHTGEKPFRCDVCGRAFSRKGNMEVHRMGHFQKNKCIGKKGIYPVFFNK